MRRVWPVMSMVVAASCGEAPSPSAAQVEGLLQRIDAMERRLDDLEETAAKADGTEAAPPSPSMVDPMSPPRLVPSSGPEAARSTISVTVRPHDLLIDGRVVEGSAARERLLEAARAAPGARLVLLAEPDVPHAWVVEVLDLAREAGLSDVAMSVRVHGE